MTQMFLLIIDSLDTSADMEFDRQERFEQLEHSAGETEGSLI